MTGHGLRRPAHRHLETMKQPALASALLFSLFLACSKAPDNALTEEDTVRRLDPTKLHVEWASGSTPEGPLLPRTYTLTHSDSTGDLYLTVGPAYNEGQVSGWYTRFMRDEVLAQWLEGDEGPELHVHCHVSGGLLAGSAGWRDDIFRRELPLVLEALRYGDRQLFTAQPELDSALVWVHFHSANHQYNRVEAWGGLTDYR